MAQTVFYIIITIIVADYILERYLAYINLKHIKTELPDELKDIYDEAEYKKSQDYKRVNSKFGLITDTFGFILILAMLLLDGFAFVDNIARQFTENPVFLALIFFGLIYFTYSVISIPFSVYGTFVIEEKFGFNKTTPKVFVFDILKSWLLTALLGGGIMALIVWIYTVTAEMFWIYAWITISGFSIFMAMFYSTLIVPLFNKQTPLEDGELRDKIEGFSQKVGFKLDNVFVIDGSKRSTKSNAYFSGLGPKKRIVLYDTLIKDLKIGELVAVLAHEIGHYKKKHIITGLITGVLQAGLMFYILSLFISNPVLSEALGTSNHSFHLALISFGILYSPFSTVLGLFMNKLSRKNEYEADRFARENFNSIDLIEALKKLSVKNLSNLTPHPLYVFFYYSHPPLLQRIRALKNAIID